MMRVHPPLRPLLFTALFASLPVAVVHAESDPELPALSELAGSTDAGENRKTTIGGYGSLHLSWSDRFRHDGTDGAFSDSQKTWDLHRFVTFLGHEFNEWIRFFSELEVEHALVEGGEESGEVELEQAYLDFRPIEAISARAGMLLIPVGIVNETHEPPTFNTVERGRYSSVIVPTTWYEAGVGIAGRPTSALQYRLYLVGGLEGEKFNRSKGARNARQEGFKTNASNPSLTGRLQWNGIEGLTLGTSFFAGGTGFGDYRAGAGLIDVPAVLATFDIDFRRSGLLFRAEAGRWWFDAATANRAWHTGQDGSLDDGGATASGMAGGYLELGYDVGRYLHGEWLDALIPFVRGSYVDLNAVPAPGQSWQGIYGWIDLTAGLHYKPVYNVSLKFDWVGTHDLAYHTGRAGGRASSTFEFGIGYYF